MRVRSIFSMNFPPTSRCKTSLRRLPRSLQSSSKFWNDISSAMSSVVSVIFFGAAVVPRCVFVKARNDDGDEEEVCKSLSTQSEWRRIVEGVTGRTTRKAADGGCGEIVEGSFGHLVGLKSLLFSLWIGLT